MRLSDGWAGPPAGIRLDQVHQFALRIARWLEIALGRAEARVPEDVLDIAQGAADHCRLACRLFRECPAVGLLDRVH